MLYAGYRNGTIGIWDLRTKPKCVWNVNEPADGKVASSVIGIHALSDGNYFISNAFNSNVRRIAITILGCFTIGNIIFLTAKFMGYSNKVKGPTIYGTC